MLFSSVLGFLGLISRPFLNWKGSIIYTGCIYLANGESSALFKCLISYLGGSLELNI